MGTQFSGQFRDLVKSEIARLSAQDDGAAAQAEQAQPSNPSNRIAAPEPVKPAIDPPNDTSATGDKTDHQPRCDVAAGGQKATDANRRDDTRHYGSIAWQAAAAPDKKPDALTQKIIDT